MKRSCLFLLSALFLAACGTSTSSVKPAPEREFGPGIWDGATLEKVDDPTLRAAFAQADYVLVGESHDDAEDHAFQVSVYESLAAGERRAALGMEMFQRPYQSVLDAYIAGEIDEAKMLEDTEWETRWGFDQEMYAPLWRAAKEAGRPLVALNARRELTKRVAKVGLDGLSEAEASDLPEIDERDDGHRQWLTGIFAGHGMDARSPSVANFVQAQLVWDETMAESAYRARRRDDVDVVVIIAGRGHVENGWGIPDRIKRRDPDARIVSVVRKRGDIRGIDGRPLATYVIVP